MSEAAQCVLVSGADGFVGQAVCAALTAAGLRVRRALRQAGTAAHTAQDFSCGDIATLADWSPALDGVDAVVHLAALTHSGGLDASRALARYRAVNLEASVRLAEQALAAGVRRFVFMSSIKVNGESSRASGSALHYFAPDDPPQPQDNYGRTKLAAEQALHTLFDPVPASLTILRPPLVYGPGQKGNLLRLTRWVNRGVPLPLSGIDNQRSLIYVGNLAHAVVCALARPGSDTRVYTLADTTLSTPALIEAIADALGVESRLFRLPAVLWHALERLPPSAGLVRRLCDSLVVNSTAAHIELGWQPPLPFDTAMARTVAGLRRARS